MASLEAELDMKRLLENSLTIEVKVRRYSQWWWRFRLAFWLCSLASKLTWVKLTIDSEEHSQPWLYYCPSCKKEITGYVPDYGEYFIVSCPGCSYQSLVIGSKDGPVRITEASTEDDFISTDCECHFTEPYGFVPEADCPVHDRTCPQAPSSPGLWK